MRRIDPHVKVLDDRVVQRAVRAGLDAIVYAPHFTRLPEIQRTARHYSSDDLLVVPGREVFTGAYGDRKHVLAIGLADPVPDFVELDAAMAEFERQDATVIAPHPEFLTVGLDADDLWTYRDLIDAIEVYNPKYLPWHTRRAHDIVDELALPAVGSSYAHLPWTVGDVWTEVDGAAAADGSGLAKFDGDGQADFDRHGRGDHDSSGQATHDADGQRHGPRQGSPEPPFGDEGDVAAALTSGPTRVRRRTGVGAASRASAELLHLLWENSVEKVDRVVCSGLEATHPSHPAYGGRFDDSAVY